MKKKKDEKKKQSAKISTYLKVLSSVYEVLYLIIIEL